MRKGKGKNPNKIYNRFDLGRVPVQVSEPIAKPETLLQLAERMQREEQERINAPVRAAERELTATLRAMNEEYRRVWTQPIEKLRNANRDYLEASTPDLGFPQSTYDQMDAEAGTAAGLNAKKTLDAFIASLPQRGIALSGDGVARFRLFAIAVTIFRNAAVTTEMLQTCFAWLSDCFAPDEMDVEQRQEEIPADEPKPLTIDDVLKQGLDGSRDSDKRLTVAAQNDWLNEHRPMVDAFLNHLQTVWGFTPTDSQWRYIFSKNDGLFVKMNWSHGDARNYDTARRICCKRGIFPPMMLTCGEVIEDQFTKDNDWRRYRHQLEDLTRRGLVNRPRAEGNL